MLFVLLVFSKMSLYPSEPTVMFNELLLPETILSQLFLATPLP